MENSGQINFYFGEVVNVDAAVSTYKQTDDRLYPIDVRVFYNSNYKNITALPASLNNKQIPYVGETVLMFQGYNRNTQYNTKEYEWFYLPAISIRSSMNHNILPINSLSTELDENVKERNISPLQAYRGDVIQQGRWGNSIRLSSTILDTEYDVQPSWQGKIAGDPIIAITNSPESSVEKSFVAEDIKSDYSSLYLTSTQRINNLILNNDPKNLKPTEFENSQLIGCADRIVLTTKSDSVVIDSKKDIQLLASEKIYIGNGQVGWEGLVQGSKLISVLNQIITAINFGMESSDGIAVTPISPLSEIDLTDLTSQEILMSTWRNVGV